MHSFHWMKWERILNRRFLITKIELNRQDFEVFAEYEETRNLVDVTCESIQKKSILGNIYIGRVKDIVNNLNAAFIDIGNNLVCYYPLEDCKSPIFTHKIGKKPLCQGDELVVQVTKEAIKTKFPVVTTNLNFSGNHLILTTENHQLGISNKLNKEKKNFYKELFADTHFADHGVIVRTNAANASPDALMEEYRLLRQEYEILLQTCQGKTVFSCLKKSEAFYLKELKARVLEETDEIITDDAAIYHELQGHDNLASRCGIRFYEDASYPLSRLYAVSTDIEAALKERVWLNSGAYLIISPTEALTVIDVNSGKNSSVKSKQEMILKINQEAAAEIAKQLRIRNLSGICIIDFINMQSKDDMDALMHDFRVALKKDTVAVQLIDITKLGLVELTRKKEKRSLYEQIFA